MDVDGAALDLARRRSGEAARFVEGDARGLPLADKSFDQVVSITALCFVDEWVRAIVEMVREVLAARRRGYAEKLLRRQSISLPLAEEEA